MRYVSALKPERGYAYQTYLFLVLLISFHFCAYIANISCLEVQKIENIENKVNP